MAIGTEKVELLKQDKSLEALKLLLEHVKEKYGVEAGEVLDQLSSADMIPLSVFTNNALSTLEIIVKYLKEEKNLSYHEAAKLLNRDDRTIWSTYNNGIKKLSGKLVFSDRGANIPITIFSDRDKSVLESLVYYLKKHLGYSFNQIAVTLGKDYQTIYTTYRRGEK